MKRKAKTLFIFILTLAFITTGYSQTMDEMWDSSTSGKEILIIVKALSHLLI